MDFIPVLLELSAWGAKHEPETAEAAAWLSDVRMDKDRLVQLIRDTVKNGGSVFAGPDNVMDRLNDR